MSGASLTQDLLRNVGMWNYNVALWNSHAESWTTKLKWEMNMKSKVEFWWGYNAIIYLESQHNVWSALFWDILPVIFSLHIDNQLCLLSIARIDIQRRGFWRINSRNLRKILTAMIWTLKHVARIPFSTYQVKKSVSLKKLLPEPGVLTIYMGKLEIPIGKSNGSPHSVWEASENTGCDLR